MGIRLADHIVTALRARGDDVELIDAKAVGLPMLDRMYKEYPAGSAPASMEALTRLAKGYPSPKGRIDTLQARPGRAFSPAKRGPTPRLGAQLAQMDADILSPPCLKAV
jgi:hypothetical protein